MIDALGYCSFPARGSRGIVDVIAFQSEHDGSVYESEGFRYREQRLIPLAIQVGTTAKAVARTLAELEAAPRPIGSLPLVARRHRNPRSKRISWTFHTAAGKFATLAEATAVR